MKFLTTLRKAVEFVLWAFYQLLCAVLVMCCAGIFVGIVVGVIALIAISVERSAGVLGIVGVVAFVAVAIAGIWATTMSARKEEKERKAREEAAERKRQAEQQAKEEQQAERLEAKRKAEEARQARMTEEQEGQGQETAEQKRGKELLQRMEDLKDLLRTAKQGMTLPFGLKSIDEVAQELRKLQAVVDTSPTIDEVWQGTGGPPKPGRNWIRKTWPNEATNFTPWLARNLYLVSVCTGLDLRHGRTEVYAGGGRADIVARDHKSKSNVVIENQLDAADLDHRKQLALYGEALNVRIRIWIAANFSSTICHEVRDQNRQNESHSGGAIYYLLKLRPDPKSPISLVVGPTNSQQQTRLDFTDVPLRAGDFSVR